MINFNAESYLLRSFMKTHNSNMCRISKQDKKDGFCGRDEK
jgi:hypothetical protein